MIRCVLTVALLMGLTNTFVDAQVDTKRFKEVFSVPRRPQVFSVQEPRLDIAIKKVTGQLANLWVDQFLVGPNGQLKPAHWIVIEAPAKQLLLTIAINVINKGSNAAEFDGSGLTVSSNVGDAVPLFVLDRMLEAVEAMNAAKGSKGPSAEAIGAPPDDTKARFTEIAQLRGGESKEYTLVTFAADDISSMTVSYRGSSATVTIPKRRK